MIISIEGFKIHIIQQSTRSGGMGVVCWDIVISSAFPDISRYADGTIKQIFIQGCNPLQDNNPLLTRNNRECLFVLHKLKQFCEHNKEPFEIVGGRIKLNDY